MRRKNIEWVAQVSPLRPGCYGLLHAAGNNNRPLSSRPKRTRISYFAVPAATTCAVFLKKTA
jgi:hypothetical protein